MAEYIEREAAIGALRRRLGPNTSPAQKNMLQLAAIDIRSIKAADVAPVRRGRLGPQYIDEYYGPFAECKECGTDTILPCNYCRNCGAAMYLEE